MKDENKVLYAPGKEPQNIKIRLDRVLTKIKGAYPDKKVSRLYTEHKKWGETITELRRILGYSDNTALLEAYGFEVLVSERKSRAPQDYNKIIDELKSRYTNGPTCNTIAELKKENPDLANKFQSLMNNSNSLFGMPLSKYLIKCGLLNKKESNTIVKNEKKAEILTDKEKLENLLEELSKNFDGIKCKKFSDLCKKNSNLKLEASKKWIENIYGINACDFYIEKGYIEATLDFDKMVNYLLQKYKNHPLQTLKELKDENKELPFNKFIKTWLPKHTTLSCKDYFVQLGIVADPQMVSDSGYLVAYYGQDVNLFHPNLEVVKKCFSETLSSLKNYYGGKKSKLKSELDLKEEHYVYYLLLKYYSEKVYNKTIQEVLINNNLMLDFCSIPKLFLNKVSMLTYNENKPLKISFERINPKLLVNFDKIITNKKLNKSVTLLNNTKSVVDIYFNVNDVNVDNKNSETTIILTKFINICNKLRSTDFLKKISNILPKEDGVFKTNLKYPIAWLELSIDNKCFILFVETVNKNEAKIKLECVGYTDDLIEKINEVSWVALSK